MIRSLVCTLIVLLTFTSCRETAYLGPGSDFGDLALALAPSGNAPTAGIVSPARGGLLIRGTEPVRGLPGFGRNAIPALAGIYQIQSREGRPPLALQVWASREWLYFKSSRWTSAGRSGQVSLEGSVSRVWQQELGPTEGVLWAYELKANGPEGSRWTLIVHEAPLETEDQSLLARFYGALLRRFVYFIESARRPEDVSFPAVVGL